MYKKLTPLLLGAACFSAVASVGNELENAFNKIGGLSNTTAPSAYKAQSAGYYNGGSLYMRSPVNSTQIASVTLPSYNAGCGGIDLHMGGFSFITSSQAKGMAKNIMNDSVSYAFNLALETVSPMIANNFKDLRNVANAINSANINSCETAVGLVGSTFPKTKAAQKAVCQDVGVSSGLFKDYTSARMNCGNGGQMSQVLETAKKQHGYEKTLTDNMNFAWKAIKSNRFLGEKNDIAELFMSITGTIVVRHSGPDNGKEEVEVWPSLVAQQDLLATLLHGGDAQIYSCDTHDENGCLNHGTNRKLHISSSDSLVFKVEKMISNIFTKIKEDTAELSAEEKAFLQSTRLPIYKMINVQSAASKDRTIMDISTHSELIASDILFKYLDESINLVDAQYQALQIPAEMKAQFQESLIQARSKVKALKINNYQNQVVANQLIEQTMLIEQRLVHNLKRINDSENWASGLN